MRSFSKAPVGASYEPTVVKSSDGGSVLPLIYITGYGTTPEMAKYAANLATAAFRQYLGTKQAEARIPDDKRVEVVVTNRATTAELFEPRSIVRPIFLFLLVLMSTIALVFVLENLRPSGRRAPSEVLPGGSAAGGEAARCAHAALGLARDEQPRPARPTQGGRGGGPVDERRVRRTRRRRRSQHVRLAAPIAGAILVAAVAVRRPYVPWVHLLTVLLMVILFIPIRRYRIAGDLPFQLEPYRVLVALIVGAWVAALLVDPKVKLRRTGLELPVGLLLFAVVGVDRRQSGARTGARVHGAEVDDLLPQLHRRPLPRRQPRSPAGGR